jgi:phage terminase large subunit GpA-like protein
MSSILDDQFIIDEWLLAYQSANEDIFNFKIVKPQVVEWVEKNLYLPKTSSQYSGPFSYNMTPYWKEPISYLHSSSPVRTVSIMKCVQGGATEGVIIPGIAYTISEDPCPVLLTAGDQTLAKDTVEKRIDPVLQESNLTHLLRPHVVKKTNNKSGDTSASKEFFGGSLYARGTQSATPFRQFPAKKVFADDYDAAPRELGNEGSVKGLIEGRQNSFGEKAKSYYISTPTVTGSSNIYDQFLLGTQKAWNWPCPHCGKYVKIEFKIEKEDGSIAGIVWLLDGKGRLNVKSVGFMCPNCANIITENKKYELNLNGIWVPGTSEPIERHHESFHFNGLCLPAGFTGWVKIVEEFILANPPGQPADVKALRTWHNLRMGLPFAEVGESPRVNELMENTREYLPGIVPDATCAKDGNGSIIMLTLACDINGIMEKDNEDVRIDWEILAHSSNGPTYSVDHGSIGTFKRLRDKSKAERENDIDRDKYTLNPGMKFSVWPLLEEIIKREYHVESNSTETRSIDISCIDTGFGEKLAMQFVKNLREEDILIFGVKGRKEETYRKLSTDKPAISRSKEQPKFLYNVEVNQIKDDLAQNMKLRMGDDGSQPSGFMNYPQPTDGKYNMKNYFSHYEGERKNEVVKNGEVVGYVWEKKNNQSQNHFWDVRVYNLAAPMIYLDIVKQDSRYKNLTWEDFIMLVT